MSSDFRQGLIAGILLCVVLLVAIGGFGKLFAGETWLVGSIASHHFDSGRERGYEQRNWGLGIEQRLHHGIAITAGFYRNSQRTDSIYFGAAWMPLKLGPVSFGMAAELVSGYTKGEPLKAVFPVMGVELAKGFGINVPYVPKTERNVAAAALQVRFLYPW
jgi:hypothetical protein